MRHYEILDAAVRARGGARPVEQGEGDSVVAVFSLASEAVRAAVDIQLALAAEPWPDGAHLAVRMALHTGEAQLRDAGNYMGRAVIRTARLRAGVLGRDQTAVATGGRSSARVRPPTWPATTCPTA